MTTPSLRSTALLATALLAATLTACSPAPLPNPALLDAASQAKQDALDLADPDPELSTLRDTHATSLINEIHRICGLTDDGTVPDTCSTDPLPDPTGTTILDSLNRVPNDSVALLVRQYAEFAKESQTIKPPLEENVDTEQAEDLLKREYAAVWALGLAQAHIDAAFSDALSTALDGHRERITWLSEALGDDAPLPEASYALAEATEPTDADSALALTREIQSETIAAWQHAAVSTKNAEWRIAATILAGNAAAESVDLGV